MLNMENFTDIWIQIDLPLQYKQGDAYDLFSCYVWSDLQNLCSSLVLTLSVGILGEGKAQNTFGSYIASFEFGVDSQELYLLGDHKVQIYLAKKLWAINCKRILKDCEIKWLMKFRTNDCKSVHVLMETEWTLNNVGSGYPRQWS